MKTLFVLLILVSATSAYIEESALAALQTVDHWNIFRIIISDNTEECFYVPVKLNDTIHVIYQVLRGGNSVMRAIITDPLNVVIYSQPNHQFGWYNQDYVVIPGVYRMCFKNEEYFAAKTLYLAVLAVHQDFISEASIEVADEKIANATSFLDEFSTGVMSSLNTISGKLYRLSAYQTVARVQHLHDTYAVEANASYVQYWAIWQILTMIPTTAAAEKLFLSNEHISEMFTEALLNRISVRQNCPFKLSILCFIIIIHLFCSSHSATIPTYNYLSSSNQFELMSNSSYRNFILRQYFIDLLDISHTSLVRSMVYNHHITSRSIQVKNTRRKRSNDDTSSYSPMFTLQSSNCFVVDKQVQSTFIWSHSIESLTSIELIYHIDTAEISRFSIPVQIRFKHAQTSKEFFTINTYLQFDSDRDFYVVNIYQYIVQINNQSLTIESMINNQTCQTSSTYIIISSTTTIRSKSNQALKSNSKFSLDIYQLKEAQTDKSLSMCKLKTVQIKFEDLGLAYLIIRPKEYKFTYCDGSCSYSTLQQQSQTSMHALLKSILKRKITNIPQTTCVPSKFADDNFLLRQMDGSLEIHPIKDIIVKQCACL
ncbi:unnamed protein product [Rotaria magnacalcarata]|uniref:TGF-beta family profile domain-containing protein n=1 Tax=Rotaria magnacalcarata TaxID=392030 RepID=A0A816A2W3_9BILA|nr:unnamed protein product [Rotaria magnacalcarata]